jgi:hypothetical protein
LIETQVGLNVSVITVECLGKEVDVGSLKHACLGSIEVVSENEELAVSEHRHRFSVLVRSSQSGLLLRL